ncbi:MAG: hypothetical protein R3212_01485 [Xanthomonadales bacterium]|nr:hypothetical protein [Xanthomonadales bacterium]
MNTTRPDTPSPRARLVREAAILQLKLVADGLRDAALIPVSLIAAVIGLVRGGNEADREFRQVINLGKRSERWINLFGHHRPLARSHPAGSLDTLIDKVEDVVREQYQKGRTSPEAKAAIDEALQMVHRATEKISSSDGNPQDRG